MLISLHTSYRKPLLANKFKSHEHLVSHFDFLTTFLRVITVLIVPHVNPWLAADESYLFTYLTNKCFH